MWHTLKNSSNQATLTLLHQGRYWQSSNALIFLRQLVSDYLEHVQPGGVVLDIGSGHQPYRQLVAEAKLRYLPMDMYPRTDKLAFVGDVQAMPCAQDSVDGILCLQVLEHVPQPFEAIRQLARVVKPGGIVILSLPHLAYLHNQPHDYYRFTHHGIRVLSQSAGLTVEGVEPLGGLFCFLGYLRSSLLLPIMTLPLVGRIIWWLNWGIIRSEIYLDRKLRLDQLFPVNYIARLKKP